MAQTIFGGAYLAADGTTWQDANGKPLDGEQRTKAEHLHRERQQALKEQERQLAAQTLDPMALLRAFQGQPQPAPVIRPQTDEADSAPRRGARS